MTITTNMSKAQYEPGCKVIVRLPPPRDGSLSQDEVARVLLLGAQGPWTFVKAEFPYITLDGPTFDGNPDGVRRIHEHYRYVERDYDDAQAARRARFEILYGNFGGDVSAIEPDEPLQRFVCVQKDDRQNVGYMFGDSFEDAVNDAGSNVLDGWDMPEGVYDLDTCTKIDLHISTPVFTASDDQGATVNELDVDEVESAKAWVTQNTVPVATEFAVSITVPPDRGDEMKSLLDSILESSWVEHATVRKSNITQLDPDRAAAAQAALSLANAVMTAENGALDADQDQDAGAGR